MASSAVDFARSNQQRFLNELKDLLRIPSVSTLEEHKPDIKRAADFVANDLRRIGMENVEIIPTKGHPLIYADWLHASGKPTALCYAHYDVQPAEPLDEWITPAFEPTERNNNIYARGAVDDKGQLWMEVKALEALMKAGGGKLPINVKVIFEGEEEVGGESIAQYIRKEKAKLKADFALVKAWKGDKWGNLVYRKTARNFNPMMAAAAKVTIAEVEHLVDVGELEPDLIHTPSVYVNRIFQGELYEKRIEKRTTRKAS